MAGSAMAATSGEILEQAIQQYRQALDCADRDERLQRFQQAELLFARLVEGDSTDAEDGVRNADLFVNLGNAALAGERLGVAITAYRHALEIDPDHAQARQNLAHARTLLPDWVPRPNRGGLFDTFFAFATQLSRSERQLAAAISFLLATLLIAAGIRWQRPALRNLALLPLVVWLGLVTSLAIEARSGTTGDAVVTVDEVVARSADSVHATPRFGQPLPGGTEVQVLERRDDWWQIQLADGRDAWLPRSGVTEIRSF
jgi:tetratricopeptide (TPR) repeat protein